MKSFNENIKNHCLQKNNRLCIGLDVDNEKLSNQSIRYMRDFIFDIIENTIDHCPIYKINFAFYEKHGSKGYEILEKIPEFINNRAITIADAKRGDIGNSSKYYSKAILDSLGYDSITISPYMGEDSIAPFTQNLSKGIFILCLTSNSGSNDFQHLVSNNLPLYKHVAKKANSMNLNNNIQKNNTQKKNTNDHKKKTTQYNQSWAKRWRITFTPTAVRLVTMPLRKQMGRIFV